jgi:UDP-4-amino-4,6-dideoxy-N-acetyl-beta-L-altrosamine transaminase
MSRYIPYGKQSINEQDIQSVIEVLRSDFLTQGPKVNEFESAVARYCGARYAVAVSSGTSALHLACLAAGLRAGDALWTSPITFVASANCALYCGAHPDFSDIDPRSYNMSMDELEGKLAAAQRMNRLPKIVVPVHFAGQSCDMEKLHALSKKYDFRIIEDACHALGGKHKGQAIGSCRYSDMTVLSFHPVKIITTGEGGMVLTNDEKQYQRLLRLRTHGITRDPAFMEGASDGSWYYQQVELGLNYRITDIQAALGLSQLRRIDEFVARRNELAAIYDAALGGLPVEIPYRDPDNYSAFHLYVIRLKLNRIGKSRREVFDELIRKNIGVNVHYIPVHTQPYYRKLGFAAGQFPESERYYREAITLPLYPALTREDQEQVIASLGQILLEA